MVSHYVLSHTVSDSLTVFQDDDYPMSPWNSIDIQFQPEEGSEEPGEANCVSPWEFSIQFGASIPLMDAQDADQLGSTLTWQQKR